MNQAKFKAILSEQNDLKLAQEKIEADIGYLQSSGESVKREINEIRKFIESLLQKCPWIDPS